MNLKMHPMKSKPLELIRFFLVALPVFIIVYCTAMICIEIKEFIKK
jgi:hypothetical protein